MRHLLPFILLLMVAACSTVPRGPAADWEMKGKVSLRMQGTTDVANIHWQQDGNESLVRLTGPVGLGAVTVTANDRAMTIARSGEQRIFPAGEPIVVDGQSLVLPWRAMSCWVRGITEAGQTIPVEGVQRDGWTLRVLKKDAAGPRLMSFEHERLSIRLSVSEWTYRFSKPTADSI